jgi:hypothetical protein
MKVVTSHELCKMAKSLTENHITVFRNTLFKLLLQVPTAMLVLAKTRDLAGQVLKTSTGKTINWS